MSLPSKRIAATLSLATLLACCAPAVAAAGAGGAHQDVQHALDAITKQDGVPGALVTVRDRSGRTWSRRSGVGDLSTGDPFPTDARFRAGSITKSFVATVVLQLVAQGRIALDAPVEHYLPGLITGNGNDGTKITVRELLQHTSGLYDYTSEFSGDPEQYRHSGAAPADLVEFAVAHPPLFQPGTQWSYSNTNYIVAGMIVERVTGHSLQSQIAARITTPLGLRGTQLPVRGEERLPTPRAEGYTPVDGILLDFTDLDSTIAWASGGIVSTAADLNRFYGALLGGRLLPPAQLAEMKRTVPAPGIGPAGARYGLGLASVPLSCGGVFWGHGGDLIGFAALTGVTTDGRGATVVANEDPSADQTTVDMLTTVDAALCQS